MKIVGTDLEAWASRRRCQERLPELVRRLIHGTVPRSAIREIDFPAGEGVQKHGFDGWLSVSEGHGFLPTGFSAWEIGCDAKPKKKADKDYRDRVGKPAIGYDPNQTTFIFVTPRRWNHRKWVAEKRKDGHWADVRVIDADGLEQWLDLAPAAHVWLSRHLKKPQGSMEPKKWWKRWARKTTPPTSEALVRGGREVAVEVLYAWLDSEPSVLSVEVDELSEAAAFLIASIRLLGPRSAPAFMDRVVVAPNAETVQQLSLGSSGLIIAAIDCPIEVALEASEEGHHVLRATLSSTRASDLTLRTMPIRAMAAALERMGLERTTAFDLATECAGSLTRVRHRLGEPPRLDLQLSRWLLCPRLDESNPHDLEAVARIFERPVGEVRDELRKWSTGPTPVLVREGHTLRWASYGLGWFELARNLAQSDLDPLGRVVLEVLGDGRSYRSYQCSPTLKTGLAEVLAWAGSYPETFAPGVDGLAMATSVVSQLLARLEDVEAWDAVAELLTLLAEAAPDTWLSAVKRRVRESPLLVGEILGSAPGSRAGSAAYYGLLRALQVLGWSPRHFSDVVYVLAALVERDPGSKWHPRPALLLRHLLDPRCPQTTASLDERVAATKRISQAFPGVALGLILGFARSGSVRWDERPTVRTWAQNGSVGVTEADLEEALDHCGRIAIEIAVREPVFWAQLVLNAHAFSETQQAEILAKLMAVEFLPSEAEAKGALRDAVRDVLGRPRHGEAQPAFPNAESRGVLSTLLERLTPEDLGDQHRWLFAPLVQLPEVSVEDHKAHDEALIAQRIAAAEKLVSALSNEAMLAFVESVGVPASLGFAVENSAAERGRVFELVRSSFVSGTDSQRQFRNGILWAMDKADGEGLLRAIGEPSPEMFGGLTEVQRAELLAPLKARSEVWRVVESLGLEARMAYWRRMGPLGVPVEDAARVISSLIEAGRPIRALDVANFYLKKGPPYTPELLVSLMTAVGSSETREPDVMFGLQWPYVVPLLEQLKAAGEPWEGQARALERLVLPKVSREHREKFLCEEIESHPEAFVALVAAVAGETDTHDEADPSSGPGLARSLLSRWKRVPGQSESGFDIDETTLMSWVQRVREGLRTKGLQVQGESLLGQVLAHAPSGKDDHWPHEAVRNVLEGLGETERIEDGLIRGNRRERGWGYLLARGSGKEELELAARYEASAAELRRRWPKTSRCLEALGQGYRDEAAILERQVVEAPVHVLPVDRVRVVVEEMQSKGQYTFTLQELASEMQTDWGQASVGADMLFLAGRLVSPEPNHFQIVPFGTHGAIAKAPSFTAAPTDGDAS